MIDLNRRFFTFGVVATIAVATTSEVQAHGDSRVIWRNPGMDIYSDEPNRWTRRDEFAIRDMMERGVYPAEVGTRLLQLGPRDDTHEVVTILPGLQMTSMYFGGVSSPVIKREDVIADVHSWPAHAPRDMRVWRVNHRHSDGTSEIMKHGKPVVCGNHARVKLRRGAFDCIPAVNYPPGARVR